MPERIQVSKRTRFEIFKRDEFTCQYCGSKPPAVVLEVDHINPVSSGGGNEEHNLITSCFDCNRGKSNVPLEIVPIDIEERKKQLEERREQVNAYEQMLHDEMLHLMGCVDLVVGVYEEAYPGMTLTDSAKRSIKMFLGKLPEIIVTECMQLACDRGVKDSACFRYFCGICWNKIKGKGQ